jgi:hypothetical protein
VKLNFQVVHSLPLVDVEALFILLEGNSVPYSFTEHHLCAFHVVIHNVL